MMKAEPSDFHSCLRLVWTFDGAKDDRAPGETFATSRGVTGYTWDYAVARGIVSGELADASEDDCANILHVLDWNAMSCGLLDPGVNLMVFNDAVLTGPGHAAKLLQRIVGAKEDGVIGPETRRLANSRSANDLIDELKAADDTYLATLKNSKLYLRGWTRREDYMAQHAHAMVLI